jgi:hypothetical protein
MSTKSKASAGTSNVLVNGSYVKRWLAKKLAAKATSKVTTKETK